MASDLRDLKRQERQLLATFDGAKKFLQKYKAEKHSGQIENRLELLETAMKKFYTVRRKLELLTEEADEKDATDSKESTAERAARLEAKAEKREAASIEIIQSTEDVYCDLRSSLQVLLPKPVEQSSPTPAPSSLSTTSDTISRVKLPEIRLPSFGGRTNDWVTFRDMFQSLIHKNNQLSAMDKFSYLRSSLVGEALQEIESIEMSVANYPIAWDLLKKRYENRKLIVKAHLDALFAVEPMRRESYDALNHVITEYDKNLQMLEKVGEDPSQWSTILVHMMCSRLDQVTLRYWEAHHSSKEVPEYSELVDFLRIHCSVLQSIVPSRPVNSEVRKPKHAVVHTSIQSSNRCPFCGESPHSAFRCHTFMKMKVKERYEKVKRSGLCLNCLSSTHLVRDCAKGACHHCQQKHHTLLHIGSSNGGRFVESATQKDSSVPRVQNGPQGMNTPHRNLQAQNQTTPSQHTSQSTSSCSIANTNSHTQTRSSTTTDPIPNSNCLSTNIYAPTRQVLLSTALVRVSDMYGNVQLARALLDSCSEYCFITTKLSRKLKLVEGASYLSVGGIGGSVVQSTKKVEATIAPRSLSISPYVETIQLHVLPKLTSTLPLHAVNVQKLAVPNTVTLADPSFHEPGSIDIIIGAEYYYDLLLNERMKLADEGPTLQKTVFGWVVSGRLPGSVMEVPRTVTHSCSTIDLREMLAKFWELETCTTKCTHSVEESTCEELFERTTVRDEEGKFVVTLPKKDYVINQLGDSKAIAVKRFYGLERRFATNEELKALYSEFIREYLSMGHMREIHEDTSETPSYYMPHHAVLKPDSTTTKLRVVFDASSRTSTGVSLNEGLMVGPVVQDDLLSIVLRFRFRQFVLVADVAKMYRMVKVVDADQPLQRIIWRESPTEPLKSYQLATVTYGTAAAPYLATKCLQKLACEGEATYAAAAKVIKKDFYVDDMLTGADNLEEGKMLAAEVIELMSSAGFMLRKWNSNSDELLSTVPQDLRDDRAILELDSSSSFVKTLGLIWEPASDSFRFSVPSWNTEATITKRVVLSDTARLFDPLGLIGPVVVLAKIFMQDLWKQKADWDEVLPDKFQTFWTEYRRNISALETLSVPRWTNFSYSLKSVELHGFCDASEAAYGACLYLRCELDDGSVTVRLITSKSRVAPLEDLSRKKKKLSIPRLELSSALLLSHLYEKLRSSIEFSAKAYFWTDSTIVKCWLSSLPSRWQAFVAHRVSEIQHLTKNGVWSHVAGDKNPADIISRGMTPVQLQYETLWFNGPLWLRQDRSTWPNSSEEQAAVDKTLLEEKSTTSLPVRVITTSEIFALHSSLPDLVRLVGWIRRFMYNSAKENRANRRIGNLSCIEYNEAEIALVRLAQHDSFSEEISALSKGQTLKSSSVILSTNPRLSDGILRVGGRLTHAPVSETRKHPIILHHQHPFTKLVLEYYHRKHFHAGQQLLIASVREKYWPIRIRSLARSVIHRCISCFRCKPKNHEQLMSDLPSVRVTPGAVFYSVGLDFCGPFQIKYPGRRSTPIRTFVCIFVCLVTKAVHMEVVADLSTQAFLAALKRFVAIRGKPQTVMCDNATNFVGANRELEKLRLQFCDQQCQHAVCKYAEEEGIDFKFIPPRSPNFGGLWEAAVKSFKCHFRKTIGTRTLTYDEMHTVVQQIAAILNSRPLTPLSNDPHDYSALTPGHFLIGRPLTAIPEPDLQEIPENRLSHWQRVQDFVQQLWRKWKTQYLSDLHNRTKWTQQRDNINLGTMVLVKEDNLPPLKWQLGRVTKIFSGQDGNVRVVGVQTKDGVFTRGISKICILPIRDNEESHPVEN